MSRLVLKQSLLSALLVGAFSTVPALAGSVTFGQALEQNATQDFQLVDTGSGVTLSGSSQMYFVYSNVSGSLPLGLEGPISSTLTLNFSSSTPDVSSNGNISEGGFTGTFSITLNNPINGQTNLLSGTIGAGANLTIGGKSGGTSASLSGSTPPDGAVVYTSDFIQFLDNTNNALSLALSSVIPSFMDNGSGFLAPFDAAGSNTFSADSPSSVIAPEPVSLVLVAAGVFMMAAVLQGRRKRLP